MLIGVDISTDEIHSLMAEVDADGSGEIERADFVEMIGSPSRGSRGSRSDLRAAVGLQALDPGEALQMLLVFEKQAVGLECVNFHVGPVDLEVARGAQVRAALKSAARLVAAALRAGERCAAELAGERVRGDALRQDHAVLERRLNALEARALQRDRAGAWRSGKPRPSP